MRRIVFSSAGLAALLGALVVPLSAQTPPADPVIEACDRYDVLKARLDEQFREVPAAFGLQMNGDLLQLFVSVETGTWTIVSTAPGGASCIVAAGESWETLPEPNDDPMA